VERILERVNGEPKVFFLQRSRRDSRIRGLIVGSWNENMQ
jgi:hypothetical protein